MPPQGMSWFFWCTMLMRNLCTSHRRRFVSLFEYTSQVINKLHQQRCILFAKVFSSTSAALVKLIKHCCGLYVKLLPYCIKWCAVCPFTAQRRYKQDLAVRT